MRPSPSQLGVALVSLVLLSSCASMQFDRSTPTSGTFRSSAWSFTILSFDFPRRAVDAARENASDAGLPNTIIQHEQVIPYLGDFDFLLDLIMIRYARVRGTWGYPTLPEDAPATPGSNPGSSSPPAESPEPSP